MKKRYKWSLVILSTPIFIAMTQLGCQSIEPAPGKPAAEVQAKRAPERIEPIPVKTVSLAPGKPAAVGLMSKIPAGKFEMGDKLKEGRANERPVHTVTLGTFYIENHEVTKGLWQEVYKWSTNNGYKINDLNSLEHAGSGFGHNHPIENMNWYDAVKWCNARSEKEGLTPVYYTDKSQTVLYKAGKININNDCVRWEANGYRLPTEAEWEKAARGKLEGKRYSWGNDIDYSKANYRRPGSSHAYDNGTKPVGRYMANKYGLYDMTGNVFEWCWDFYDADYYKNSPKENPQGPESGDTRMVRGGSWYFDPKMQRCALRANDVPQPSYYYCNYGFRCVRVY